MFGPFATILVLPILVVWCSLVQNGVSDYQGQYDVNSGDLIFYFKHPEPGTFAQAVIDAAGGGPYHVSLCISKSHVIEASTDGVRQRTIQESIEDSDAEWIETYTLNADVNTWINRDYSISFAKRKVGLGYNDIFSPECRDSKGHEAYYCSQLITFAYPTLVFPPYTLNFKNGSDFLPYWLKYFKSRGCPIPQGEPGSHPAQLIRGKSIEKMARYNITNPQN